MSGSRKARPSILEERETERWLRRQRRRSSRRALRPWRHLVSSEESMEYWPTGSWSEDETSHTDEF